MELIPFKWGGGVGGGGRKSGGRGVGSYQLGSRKFKHRTNFIAHVFPMVPPASMALFMALDLCPKECIKPLLVDSV